MLTSRELGHLKSKIRDMEHCIETGSRILLATLQCINGSLSFEENDLNKWAEYNESINWSNWDRN